MAAIDSFDAILAAAAETGAVISVPGLLNWLGVTGASQTADAEETYEDYLNRLSQEATA